MNSYYVIYSLATGEIQQSLCAPAGCTLPLSEDQGSLEAFVPPGNEQAFWVSNGMLQERGLPPSPEYVWTGAAWEADLQLQSFLAAEAALRQRFDRLTASDWTQLPDVPEATRARWADYRQALRDITAQPGYPLVIDWPQEPSSLPPVLTLEQLKVQQKQAAAREMQTRIYAPIDLNGTLFDGDDVAQANVLKKITEMRARLDLGLETPVSMLVWRDYANAVHQWETLVEYHLWLSGYAVLLSTRGTLMYRQFWIHSEMIETLQTAEEVLTYDITAGWV